MEFPVACLTRPLGGKRENLKGVSPDLAMHGHDGVQEALP